MNWQVDDSQPVDVHVIPLDDFRPHDAARTCWCHPDEEIDNACVVTHHAMDGRERHENGAPLH